MENLAAAIRAECQRLKRLYHLYGFFVPSGTIAQAMLLETVQEGEHSIASGDQARMMRALEALRNFPKPKTERGR